MAACLRRAVSSRSALLQRYIVSLQSRGPVSSAISSPLTSADDFRPVASSLPYLNICYRGFAKSKKSNDHSGGGSVDMEIDIGPGLKEGAEAQMDAAIIALSRDLAKLRTGRASAGMLDHIIVEVDGVKMPLIRLAVVSVLDPKTLSVNPYDPNTLKTLESAIVSSPLGLNPKVDGQRLIAAIPPLTKEHMQAMCKVVTKSCEDVKQSIRRARQKRDVYFEITRHIGGGCILAFLSELPRIQFEIFYPKKRNALDTVKKASSGLSKDHAKKLEREVDDLTKKFIKSAEDMCRAKEKEITSG